MAKKAVKDFGLSPIVHLILQIVVGFLWGGIIRLGRGKLLLGILYIVTVGFFGIGWIIDVVTLILKGDYTVLA